MNDFVTPLAAWSAALIEAIGIAIITIAALYALFNALTRLVKKDERKSILRELRHFLGRGILLGLEFLIAADIIYTVAVDLTFESIGALALIVLIRTFLSITLEVEITGKWPWRNEQ